MIDTASLIPYLTFVRKKNYPYGIVEEFLFMNLLPNHSWIFLDVLDGLVPVSVLYNVQPYLPSPQEHSFSFCIFFYRSFSFEATFSTNEMMTQKVLWNSAIHKVACTVNEHLYSHVGHERFPPGGVRCSIFLTCKSVKRDSEW